MLQNIFQASVKFVIYFTRRDCHECIFSIYVCGCSLEPYISAKKLMEEINLNIW